MDIETVTAYMAEHLADEISMEKVAKHFHYAPAYFSRQFKKTTGVTFRKYLESMRIQSSMSKLLIEEDKVTNIAGQVGYDYSSNFAKIFKRHTGGQAKVYKQSASLAYTLLQDFMKAKEILYYRHTKEVKTTASQVKVNLIYPEGYQPGLVFVGLFPNPLPNQVPIVGLAATATKNLCLDRVPAGRYYLLACDATANASFFSTFVMLDNYRARWEEVLDFSQDKSYEIDLVMEEPQPHHPLITVNLPKLVMDSLFKKSK